jgi:hypothetical protein
MNKASDQDDFRLRRSALRAFVPMAAFAMLAAVSAAQHPSAPTAAQHVTVTQTIAGERPMHLGVAKHNK